MRRIPIYLLACSAWFHVTGSFAQGASPPLPRNSFGSVGLIDMPSARMMPDGSLSAGASFQQYIEHFNFAFQATPWLETGFRYSGLQHLNSNYSVYFDRSFAAKIRLWDENGLIPAVAVGANDLVGTGIYSGEFLVASKQLGPFDLTAGIGWGRLGSTNAFQNPFSIISRSLEIRGGSNGAGATAFDQLFHGPIGLFGGIVWQTPLEGLDLLAEYSSDKYDLETLRGTTASQSSQFNFGAAYKWDENINLSLDWMYGDRLMGAVLFQFDVAHDPFPQKIGPAPVIPRIRSNEEQQRAINVLLRRDTGDFVEQITSSGALVDALWAEDSTMDVRIENNTLILTTQHNASGLCFDAADIAGRYMGNIEAVNVFDGRKNLRCPVTGNFQGSLGVTSQTKPILVAPSQSATVTTIDMRTAVPSDTETISAKLRAAIAKQNIAVIGLDYNGQEIILYYTNASYFSEREVVKRLISLLMAHAPATVEKFRLVSVYAGLPQREFDVLRIPAERSISQRGALDLTEVMTSASAPMQNPALAATEGHVFPNFSWAVFPQFRQQLFDPDNPFAVQFIAGAFISVEMLRGLTANAEGEFSLYDNFNVSRPPTSDLPHVRTDFLKFFTLGKNGIGQLDVEYRSRLAPEVFATVKAGYLESMYAGVGGEILWRPQGERWAIGADVYGLRERGFNRLLDFQHYDVVTGHVSLYWASPWYDLNFEVRAGRYLAGDRGITFAATRRFSSGVEIGAFFTRTNVSADQFGEGSFDKGIIVRIPLGWIAPLNTQSTLSTIIKPVQRDGGQTLSNDATLYEETRRASEAEMFLQTGEHF